MCETAILLFGIAFEICVAIIVRCDFREGVQDERAHLRRSDRETV